MTAFPCELVLEIARATNAGSPYAFVLQHQIYVRRLDSGASRSAAFPWGEPALERLAALQQERASPEAAAWLAEELRAFLEPLGWERDEERLKAELDADRTVHITIRLGAAELYALPWELVPLGATGRPLGSLPGCLIRYEWPATTTARPEPNPPPEGGRILFAWSAAGGAVPAGEHLDAIASACCAGSSGSFNEERDVLPRASLKSLQDALRASPVAVLHLLCHGGQLDGAASAYGLVLNSEDGAEQEVIDARSLQIALADHARSLRLVVLCACYGGDGGARSLDARLGSVAQELHRLGVPAVVASRYPLETGASVELTETLYHSLLAAGLSLEEAFQAAKSRLRARPNRSGWASMQLYARAADGPDHRPIVVRPYRGLLAFQREHARCFFGRDAEVAEALQDLTSLIEAKSADKPRFLIVTGASGTGKSSIVLAGVVPGLAARDERWTVAILRPHDQWKAALEAALAAREDKAAPILIIADQFEEIFTSFADKEGRAAFVRELWRLSADPASGVAVVATLRVDFLAHCSEIAVDERRTLEDVAYDEAHRVFIRSMKAEQMREIIERPARAAGLELETGLTEQILEDAGQEPGALPLVEYTLDELWQRREGRRLTWEEYRRLGGITGALEKKADSIVEGMSPARQRAARRLLVQLVDTRGGASMDTRRHVKTDALRRGPAPEAAAIDEVLRALAAERLLVLSEDHAQPEADDGAAGEPDAARSNADRAPIVEIAHEQLIRSWGTLRGWLEQDRQKLAELQQVEAWVSEAEGFHDFKLDGDQLGHARALLGRYPNDIGEGARRLIAKSEKAAKIRRGIAVSVTTWIALSAVAMFIAALWAFSERDKALKEQERAIREAERAQDALLVTGARELLGLRQPAPATRLLLEVKDTERLRGWSQVAQDLLSVGIPSATLRGHSMKVVAAAWSPDGKRVVTAADDGTARVWKADGSGDSIKLEGHMSALTSVSFSPDGERVLTASNDASAMVWNADGSGKPVLLKGHAGGVVSAAWSLDGKRIVTASFDKTARVWSADGSGEAIVLQGGDFGLRYASFSPDGERVAATSLDPIARVWKADGSGEPILLRGHEDEITSIAWSPDSKRIVTSSKDKTARVWSADGSREPIVLRGPKGYVNAAAWSPEGDTVATASEDETVAVWNADGAGDPVVFTGHEGPVVSVAFSPDGKRIVSASRDRTAIIWSSLGYGRPTVCLGHERALVAATFSPDSRSIVTASEDYTARVWKADGSGSPVVLGGYDSAFEQAVVSADGKRVVTRTSDGAAQVWSSDVPGDPIVLRGHQEKIEHIAISPDGKRVATASQDMTARVWTIDDPKNPAVLSGHAGPVVSVAWSPDGKRVATASQDMTARVWTIDDPKNPAVLSGHAGPVVSVAWSPDGERLATASGDTTVRVWSPDGGSAPVVLRRYSGPLVGAAFVDNQRVLAWAVDGSARVRSADDSGETVALGGHQVPWVSAVSADGKRAATYAADGTVQVRSTDGSGEPVFLRGHELPVSSASFSPDGKRIVTTSHDGTVRVWSTDGLSVPTLLSGHGAAVISAAFLPDGERVVTTCYDRAVRVWRTSAEALRRTLDGATSECVSPAMRVTYLRESDDEARGSFEACERRYGRTPSRGPMPRLAPPK